MRSAGLAIALLSLTFTYAAFGQTGGTITGLISDPAGAVVANAPVEAKNTATGVVLSAATSATGNYVFGAVPAGTYEISATSLDSRSTCGRGSRYSNCKPRASISHSNWAPPRSPSR